MYRPVACLTFAVNWYLGQDNVYGYHLVNIAIHILTAFILFLFIINLFNTPVIKNKDYGDEYFIALLSATLWAINPIQVQAVTYIVQRMASLCAMFYILGLYFYISGRNSNGLKPVFYYVAVIISFMLAIGSKENAITLPIAIMLIELIFYQSLDSLKKQRILLISSSVCIGLTVIAGILLFLNGHPLQFLNGYAHRSFTFWERLLTESRIVVGYIAQIFYPIASRLSIEHDILLSISLFKPWTTLPSIVIIVSSIITL